MEDIVDIVKKLYPSYELEEYPEVETVDFPQEIYIAHAVSVSNVVTMSLLLTDRHKHVNTAIEKCLKSDQENIHLRKIPNKKIQILLINMIQKRVKDLWKQKTRKISFNHIQLKNILNLKLNPRIFQRKNI